MYLRSVPFDGMVGTISELYFNLLGSILNILFTCSCTVLVPSSCSKFLFSIYFSSGAQMSMIYHHEVQIFYHPMQQH